MQLTTFTPTDSAPADDPPEFDWIKIDHKTGQFVLRGARGRSIAVVILGLVKQRTMWPPREEKANREAQCRSVDGELGTPTATFPWGEWSAATGDPNILDAIDCAGCPFAKFHGNRPRCGEEWVTPVLMHGDALAAIRFSASGIKPLRDYLAPLVAARLPAYTRMTNIKLERVSSNGMTFAKPSFSGSPSSDDQMDGYYSDRLREIRELLTSPPDPITRTTGRFTPL